MHSGDVVYIIVLVLTVLASLAKAKRKRMEASSTLPPVAGRGTVIRRLLEEMQEAPTRPAPRPVVKETPAPPKTVKTVVEEVVAPSSPLVRPEVRVPNPLLESLELEEPDTWKKAVLYSEILRPKF